MSGAPSGIRVLSGRQLLGRDREREALDRLLEGGRGGVLVVHGEPGIGKTALLEYAVETGREFRVARICGVESEMELAFAALQQLCSPYLELIEHLPDPQRDALAVAFGLGVGPAPNPFLVGLAVLGLLAEVAEEQPLLCVVDDGQWLDSASAQALAFVGRRLLENITLVFATRERGEELRGLPDLEVRGLSDADASALLSSVVPSLLDEQVRGRIVSETRGNPLALLELPRGLTPAQLAGGLGLVAAGALADRIEESFARRLEGLSNDTRLLLLLAAADPVGNPLLLWRAAEKLGILAQGVADIEIDGLLTLGEQVTFRHPLVRSAVYGTASAPQRRAVHSALADVTDRRADADRRAWHLAAAASAPDEEVAGELERSAGRAQARGGLAAAAAFLQRSVALTGDPARRTDRALAAARAHLYAGEFDAALRLLRIAKAGSLDELQRANANLVRAQIAFASTRGSAAPTLLLNAARQLESVDVDLARAAYLEAFSAAMFAGRFTPLGSSVHDVARAAMAAPQPLRPQRMPDVLLDALATLFTEGYQPALPILRQAQSAFDAETPVAEQLHWLWLASIFSALLWDDVRWETLSERNVQLARETGALGELTHALGMRANVHFFAGELATAASLVDEIRAVAEATGRKVPPYAAVGLAAMRGRDAETVGLIDNCREELTRRGEGIGISVLDWAEAVLYNGLGRYEEACAAAIRVAEHPDDVNSSSWGMVELIEAAVRAGTPELATEALRRLLGSTLASNTDWGLGIAARSRALLSDENEAEPLYREAIERLGRTRLRPELARAHLLYGEWLRRQRRHTDAREELRIAHEMFNDFGMEAFAQRTRRELQATGERPRRRTPDTRGQLTAQEMRVAHLAAEGRTNREIAAQLFISPNTVDYHLRKAFRKLDVKWRTQLVHRLR
jgi:DNA-binding CsgD family transcriptional regulator